MGEVQDPMLVLVPSVVVPDEINVLVDPLHPDVRKLAAKKIRRWLYDPRALGLSLPLTPPHLAI